MIERSNIIRVYTWYEVTTMNDNIQLQQLEWVIMNKYNNY